MDSRVVSVLRAAVSGLNNSRNSPVSVSCWQLVQGVPANSSGLRPTHYWSTAKKLVEDLINQNIIGYAGKQRSKRCVPAYFVEKPGRVPLALRRSYLAATASQGVENKDC